MLWSCAAPVWAGSGGGTPGTPGGDLLAGPTEHAAAELLDFDIPAQALATALHRYASMTGRPALFSSAMVAGRMSNAVRGRYTREAALDHLLERTGLVAQQGPHGADEVFVLKRVAADDNAVPPPDGQGVDWDYGTRVQARVWKALCADARTTPGDYRVLLRFEVDASGQLRRARLLTSTGGARRDAAVLDVLRKIRMQWPPPPEMAQPVTMVLLPSEAAPVGGTRCDQFRETARP